MLKSARRLKFGRISSKRSKSRDVLSSTNSNDVFKDEGEEGEGSIEGDILGDMEKSKSVSWRRGGLEKRRSIGKRGAFKSSDSIQQFLLFDAEDSDVENEEFGKSMRELMNYTKYERIKDWLNSLTRLDPRWQIKVFFNECARAGVSNIEEKGISVMDLSPLLKYFSKNQVFTVWRPTSNESIRKMMTGEAVGKGLGIKGKSAKKGLLSAYVPFLQIHSKESHKNQIATLLKDARIRVFFRTDSLRQAAIVELENVKTEMIDKYRNALVIIEREGEVSDEVYEEALVHMKLQMTDPTIILVDDNAPQSYGIDIPERLFWEAFVVRKDITRIPGSPMDTGRPSEPAFQDMNFATTRKPKKYDPKAVVFQYGGHADNDPLCPLTLLMAYEENGRVCPVASDFDGFLMGTKCAQYENPLPQEQIEALKRTVNQIGEILDDDTTRNSSWTTNWLNILKKNTIDGVKTNMPQYGYGDPRTYCIMENAIGRLRDNGAVRHGSECFNYFFPQELDDEFLVISDNFEDGSPWKYLNVIQLQEFLMCQIDRGYTFPLNPKWVMCDPGWGAVYDKLLASQHPNVQNSIDAWLPPGSGIREKIESIRQRHPSGFVRKKHNLNSRKLSASGFEKDSTYAMDLAKLQLKRYLALQRAKKKLRIVLLFLRITQNENDTAEDKRRKFLRLSVTKSQDNLEHMDRLNSSMSTSIQSQKPNNNRSMVKGDLRRLSEEITRDMEKYEAEEGIEVTNHLVTTVSEPQNKESMTSSDTKNTANQSQIEISKEEGKNDVGKKVVPTENDFNTDEIENTKTEPVPKEDQVVDSKCFCGPRFSFLSMFRKKDKKKQ